MKTHTNGEWQIIEQENGQLWIFSNTPTGLDSICQITPATSITAISPGNKLGIRKSDEVDANAKLIASAPELLKALIKIKTIYGTTPNLDISDFNKIGKISIEAINKTK